MSLKSSTRPHPVKVSQISFLNLPPEVRNMIYHLTLVAEEPLEIRDLHLQEFKAYEKNGQYQLRSTYTAPDHASEGCTFSPKAPLYDNYDHYAPRWTCSFSNKDVRFQKTTYTLRRAVHVNRLLMAMLFVNRQVRLEAASVFYGVNTYLFSTMSSVIPFFKDRTPETRKFVHSIQLNLPIYRSDWYSVTTAYNRPDTWKKAFAFLAKLLHLGLKTVCILINDENDNLYVDDSELETKHMQWLHQLSKITNLDKLGVTYTYRQWQWERYPFHRYYGGDSLREEIDSQTEQEIWAFLAPKMLKMPGDDVNALLERRIWDFEDDPEANMVFDETSADQTFESVRPASSSTPGW